MTPALPAPTKTPSGTSEWKCGVTCKAEPNAPWGELFGALGDEFGINWMFNSAQVKKV